MRRLPVYLMLDVSESMVGENLARLEEGVGTIVANLRTDPSALETVHLSVVAFAGVARTLSGLEELATFRAPALPIGSGTSLGAALHHTMDAIDRDVVRPSAAHKGDWAPIVYLFTDGKPTDALESARTRWHRDYAGHATLIAVAIGQYADQAALRTLTEHVLVFDDRAPGGFEVFVRWVTESMTVQSQRLGGGVSLAKPDARIVVEAGAPGALIPSSDPDCVVLVGRCQTTCKPYLVKYERRSIPIHLAAAELHASGLAIAGAFPINETYFDWSAGPSGGGVVSTADIAGVAPCPHCGSASTVAVCVCGKLMCVRGPGEAVCPWCGNEGEFAPGEDDFDIERRLG
jgi:uncharacterized protein YegL